MTIRMLLDFTGKMRSLKTVCQGEEEGEDSEDELDNMIDDGLFVEARFDHKRTQQMISRDLSCCNRNFNSPGAVEEANLNSHEYHASCIACGSGKFE